MKKFIIPMLMMMSVNTFAGAERGNGGISYVCRNANNQITSARILDLWEPETFETLADNSLTPEEQFNKVIQNIRNIDSIVAKEILKVSRQIEANTIFTKKALPLTNDAIPDFEPENGCKLEQLARYGYSNEAGYDLLRISSEIYNSIHLSNTDRAALKMHEILYYIDVKQNAKNSLKVRKIVSHMFSREGMDFETKKNLMELVENSSSSDNRVKIYSDGPIMHVDFNAEVVGEVTCRGNAGYIVLSNDGETIESGSVAFKTGFFTSERSVTPFEKKTLNLEAGKQYRVEKNENWCSVVNTSVDWVHPARYQDIQRKFSRVTSTKPTLKTYLHVIDLSK